MSYYYKFNREKLLRKVHDRYHNQDGKKKAAEYYHKNKEMIKERERNKYKMKKRKKKIK